MATLQTLLALAVLIYVLCVIVQAVQEVFKSLLDSKASTMEKVIHDFMDDHLRLDQVKSALEARGLDIATLEHFSKDDFRQLLNGIQLAVPQIQGVLATANATEDQVKDHIAGVFDAARAEFQKSYTTRNKQWALAISFIVVLSLNASVIRIYDTLAVDQKLSQAIAGTASTVTSPSNSGQNTSAADAVEVYRKNRETITKDLNAYPILLRTRCYPEDLRNEPFNDIAGLLCMGILVSLGAPFWNDVLKGIMGVNNTLNSGKKAA